MNEIIARVTVEDVIDTIKDSWGLERSVEITPDTPLREIDGEIRDIFYLRDFFERLGLLDYVDKRDEDRIDEEGKRALLNISSDKYQGWEFADAEKFRRLSHSSTLDFCNIITPQNLADMVNYPQPHDL